MVIFCDAKSPVGALVAPVLQTFSCLCQNNKHETARVFNDQRTPDYYNRQQLADVFFFFTLPVRHWRVNSSNAHAVMA